MQVLRRVAAIWYDSETTQRWFCPHQLEVNIITQVKIWFRTPVDKPTQAQRVFKLRKMVQLMSDWLAPRQKGGRSRTAPKVSRLHLMAMPVLLLLDTMYGKKRVLDKTWTRFLPRGVMQRILLGCDKGEDLDSFLDFLVAAARGDLTEGMYNYVIVSRQHAKWYAGVFRARRLVNGRPHPGAQVRHAEHLEGMADPRKAKGAGVKYILWAKRPRHQQLLLPFHHDSIERCTHVESYQLAVFNPPANSRGTRLSYEDDTWEEKEKRAIRNRKPPRWQRKDLTCEEAVGFNFWGDAEQQRKCFTWDLIRRERDATRKKASGVPTALWHAELPIDTYRRYQEKLGMIAGIRVQGPLDMYDEEFDDVFLQHLGTPKKAATAVFLYRLTTPAMVRLLNRAQDLPRETKRSAIVAKLAYLLKIRGVLSVAEQHVRVPKVGNLSAASLRATIAKCIRQSPVEMGRQDFWLSKLKIHESAEPSLHRHARDHRIVAKEFDIKREEARTEHEKWRARRWDPIVIMEESLDVPAVVDPKFLSKRVRSEVCRWMHTVGMPKIVKKHILQEIRTDIWFVDQPRPGPLQRVFAKQFEVGPEETLVGLDRNVRAAARMTRATYEAGLYDTYVRDTIHYRVVPTDGEDEALARMRQQVNRALPRWMRRRPMSIGREYTNIKEKCCAPDTEGVTRLSCQRPHSHWREVSVQNTPYRTELQSAARAVEHINRADPAPSFSSQGLHVIRSELQLAYDTLQKPLEWRCACRRCGEEKPPTSLLRGDGTQMFKEVENSEVLRSFQESAGRVQVAYGMRAVVETMKDPKIRGPRFAKIPFRSRKMRVWSFGWPRNEPFPVALRAQGDDGRSLERMLRATSHMRLSKLGRHLLERLRGVEMGGSASPVKANIVFSAHERRRLKDVTGLITEGFLLQGECVESVVGGVRYADDLVLLSGVLCPACLGTFGTGTYKAPLEFTIEEQGALISFCDLILWSRESGLEMWRHDPNFLYVLGAAPTPKKVRYPPYMGRGITPRRKVRAWLAGSWHVEVQKTPDWGRRRAGVLRPLGELLIKGFPIRELLKAAAAVQSPAVRQARDYSRRWLRALRARYGPSPQRAAVQQELYDVHVLTGALEHLRAG